MKLFKTLREEALEKVKNAKVFADKKSVDNEKDSAFSKKGQEAKSDSGELEYGADKNKVHVTEEATVKTRKYSWGTMKTVHHGADFSIPLHPEHQEAIGKLKDEQEHKFKDETGHHWVARRKGDTVHFDTTGNGSLKTHVPMKHITEAADVDQAYADWQDSVKKKNPEHADKIKFKSNADQRHVISAEHGDRSFGTFNMKTGESEHLGEALDNKAALRAKMAEHEAKALEANKQGDDAMVKHHQDKINKIKTKMANLIRNEEVELGEARSLEDKIKVAKEIYAEKLKSATSPADRAQAKEDHENLIKKLSESESLDEVSKTTLVSYIKKAARSAAEAGNVAGFKAGKEQPKYNVSDETPTEIKRHKGIALAARKLSK